MSNEINQEEYYEELCVLLIVGAVLIIVKLYACCVLTGASSQARQISQCSDPLSRVRNIPQGNSRSHTVDTGKLGLVRELRYLEEKNTCVVTDNSSQTYY